MSVRSDLLDGDSDVSRWSDEWHGGNDAEHCDPPPGAASGFEDDWWEPEDEPREWPEHDPEARTKCHGWEG